MHAGVLQRPLDTPSPVRSVPTFEATALRKSYGSGEQRVDALNDVSLTVARGEIVGILGPNGAGKTTLVEIFEGLRSADTGTAKVLGQDVRERGKLRALRDRIGVAMQHSVLPPSLNVQEVFRLHAALYSRAFDVDELIVTVGLEEKSYSRIAKLSSGQQQRVVVGLALIGDPDVLMLDEPTASLDPQARHLVWELVEAQRTRRNASVLLTTHYMEEAERLCDRVLVIDHGTVLAEDSPSRLIDQYCPQRLVRFTTNGPVALDAAYGTVEQVAMRDGRIRVTVQTGEIERVITELMSLRARGEVAVEDLHVERKTLEDVFLTLTGRRIRD